MKTLSVVLLLTFTIMPNAFAKKTREQRRAEKEKLERKHMVFLKEQRSGSVVKVKVLKLSQIVKQL